MFYLFLKYSRDDDDYINFHSRFAFPRLNSEAKAPDDLISFKIMRKERKRRRCTKV